MTLIIEKPNADAERTTRTPGSPCRLTVNGYVIWSSTSCGDRPDQSENTITWLSERSGIASIGVVRSAQYPQPAQDHKESDDEETGSATTARSADRSSTAPHLVAAECGSRRSRPITTHTRTIRLARSTRP